MKHPRILFIAPDGSASTWYRQAMVHDALKAAGYPVAICAAQDDARSAHLLLNADMLIVSRLAQSVEALHSIEGAQQLGKKVFIDYDDNVLGIPEHNPSFVEDTTITKAILRTADGIIVTNDALAATLRPYAKRVAVLPNRPHVASWPRPERSGPLTIGLTGSPSHIEDWKLVAEPMRAIQEKYPEIRFLVAGFLPDYLKPSEFVEWVDIFEYPQLINRIDIGLCPLIDDQFNRCKSPIKAFELGLAGAAVVGSPTQYRTVLQGRGTIARTEQEWFDGIEAYIINPQLRQQHAAKLTTFVHKLDIDRNVRDVAGVYAGLYRSASR